MATFYFVDSRLIKLLHISLEMSFCPASQLGPPSRSCPSPSSCVPISDSICCSTLLVIKDSGLIDSGMIIARRFIISFMVHVRLDGYYANFTRKESNTEGGKVLLK